MSHPLRTTFLFIVAIVFLTGCSTSQVFQLILTVVDKSDGKPITAARVVVDTGTTNEEMKNDPIPPETSLQTDEAGRVDYNILINGYSPRSSDGDGWYL